ncbi:hypothetical protein [Amphibiibacter pelophylacis]|uniref:Uncharacterized protein n=1 Tax=Amphibiibacter pelophylacis TaxID=1799477 RepID=A0ACC6P569_9BURK
MKKNTLALFSSLSLSVMLAACGGGGSSEDTRAVPAAWDGTWASPEPCTPSYPRTDSSGDYYDAGAMFISNSTDQTLILKEIAYTDDKCTQKAGALEVTFDGSQFKQASFDGYQNARTGVITVSNVKISSDGDGSGFTLNPEPIYKGAQNNQSFGINASGQLCGASSNGDLKVAPNMAKAGCGNKQK